MRYLFTKYAYFTWAGSFVLNFVKRVYINCIVFGNKKEQLELYRDI